MTPSSKQPGCSPMQMDRKCGFLLRQILSASYLKGSKAGLMLTGPFWNFAPGSYRVNYYLRARAPHHTATSTNEMALPPGDVCILEVRDAASGHAFSEVLSSMTLRPEDFGTGPKIVDVSSGESAVCAGCARGVAW